MGKLNYIGFAIAAALILFGLFQVYWNNRPKEKPTEDQKRFMSKGMDTVLLPKNHKRFYDNAMYNNVAIGCSSGYSTEPAAKSFTGGDLGRGIGNVPKP